MADSLLMLLKQTEAAEDNALLQKVRAMNKCAKADAAVAGEIASLAERLRDAIDGGKTRSIQTAIAEIRKATEQIILAESDTGNREPALPKPTEQHRREAMGFPPLPEPPDLTPEMARAFIKACNGKLKSPDSEPRIVSVGKLKYETTKTGFLSLVGRHTFGKSGYCTAAVRYIEIIAEGKTHVEAKQLAEKETILKPSKLPNPPHLTSAMAQALIATCDGKLSSKDAKPRTIVIGEKTFEDKTRAIIMRIGYNVFDDIKAFALSIRYIELLASGKSHAEAKAMTKKEDNAIFPVLPNPPDLTAAMAKAIITAHDGKLRSYGREPKVISVDGQKYEDNQMALIGRVSYHLFGKGGIKWGPSIHYIELLAEDKSHEEAHDIVMADSISEETDHPSLPNPPLFTTQIAKSLLTACKRELSSKDSKNRIITIGRQKYQDSVRSILRRIGLNVFNNLNAFTLSIRYIELIAEEKTHFEAKLLAETGNEAEEDYEFEQLSKLNLGEVISFFRSQEGGDAKLKIYLMFARGYNETQANKIVTTTFKALYGSGLYRKEDEYLTWPVDMPQPKLSVAIPLQTEGTTITLAGIAPESECVFISGPINCRKKIEPDGTFSLPVPLAIGETNEIRIMSIDRTNKRRSMQKTFVITQEGEVDDTEELIRLLSELGGQLTKQIREDPGRQEFLAECMERLLIKKFSKSFEDGKRYTQEQLTKVKHPELKNIIRRVLENFRWIEEMSFPNVQEGELMFFQKYCVYRLRKAIDDPRMEGINLCNDPGLGKTRTILAAVADQDASIFTHNAVVSTWKEEAEKVLIDPDLLVLRDDHKDRKRQLRGSLHERRVTNVEFLRKVEDKERFGLISSDQTVVVHDEAHSRKNEHSEQSKGAKMLPHRFVINVTATLARNPTELRRMLHTVDPERKEFKSDEAFRRAFPMRDARAARQLKLILDQYTIRFRKHEVLEEIDPKLPLEDQLHRLPRKEHISPKVIGNFEMTEEQADSIYQMFVNWPAWTKKYGKYIPKDDVHQEDGLRTNSREGFAKIHAYRQVINNPGFAGVQTNEDPKAWQMQRIVRKCFVENRKVVIFCKYQAQAEKYAELFRKYKPALYTGQTSKKGTIRNQRTGKPACFSNEFDENGYPIEDAEGAEMSHLDYERRTFQNANERKIIIATYSAGSVGTTFTAGKVIIYDDLPTDCKEDIQAEDRIHRIDPNRQTHATVQYYQMQSRYPRSFLERMKTKWVRRNRVTGTWDEYKGKSRPKDDDLNNPWFTAHEAFFEQGTYDKVQSRNLKGQRTMFHLINDGIADESTLSENDIQFSLFADEIERTGTLTPKKK